MEAISPKTISPLLCHSPNYLSGSNGWLGPCQLIFKTLSDSKRRLPWAQVLHSCLVEWRERLPPHLASSYPFAADKHRRVVLLLHIAADHLQAVLGRPYLLSLINSQLDAASGHHTSSAVSQTIHQLADLSLSGAKAAVILLHQLAQQNLLEGEVWYDFFYVHHCALILTLPFLSPHHNPADKMLIMNLLNLAPQLSSCTDISDPGQGVDPIRTGCRYMARGRAYSTS